MILVKSVYKCTESLSFLGPKVLDILPNAYKDKPDLNSFKVALKKWKTVNYFLFCQCWFYSKIEIELKFGQIENKFLLSA